MDKIRWFKAGPCLIVWEGENADKAFYHGTCHGWVDRHGGSGPDDEITTFGHKEITQADAIKHMDKRGWDHPPITMTTSNTKRWFKDRIYIIVWEGEQGWFYRGGNRGWEERCHHQGPDYELSYYNHKEIAEVFALAELKALGASPPPGMGDLDPDSYKKASRGNPSHDKLTGKPRVGKSIMTEWYHNQHWEERHSDGLDSGVAGYRIDKKPGYEETRAWMHSCWEGSRFSASEIRENCTRVNSEQEAKEGSAESTSAFDVGRNELLSAMTSTRVLLVDTGINVADRLQSLRSREGQIGERIERFKREHVSHAF